MAAVRLPLADVGDVHLDNRDADGADAIGQGDGSVGIGTRVHHNGIVSSIRLLEQIDKDTFVVRLAIGHPVLRESALECCQILLEGDVAVYLRFAFP